MSKSLAGSFKTVIMSIVVGLLLVSLAIWGVSDAFTPATKDAAAMVGKEKITLREFDTYFKRRLSEENKKLPNRLTTKEAYARGFHNNVLSQLITEKLIQQDADDLGVDVNRRDARAFVEGMDVFNNVITGKLDEAKMAQRLAQSDARTSPKQFEKDVFKALRQQQTLSSISAGILAPHYFAQQQYDFMTELRTVNLLHLSRDAVAIPSDPTDDALKAYIAENSARYIAPEYRQFTVVRAEVSDILPDMEASEEEIKEQFDYKVEAELLGTEETRSFLQIIGGDQATADLITKAINAGQSPDETAVKLNLEAPIVYTNAQTGASSDPKTGALAFTLEAGKAQTLKGSFGTWYSVLVTGITPALVPSLENEREAIALEIRTEKAEQFVYSIQDKIQSGLDDGLTLEDVAKTHKIPVASFDFISRSGETQEGIKMAGIEGLPGISEDDMILKEIFTSDAGFEGDLFETASKGIAAVRVDSIKESTQRDFKDIRSLALAAWHIEHANKALGVLLNDVAARASKGETLETIAKSIKKGANVRKVTMLRIAPPPVLGSQLAVRMFEARQGQTIRGIGANGLDRILGQIIEIKANTDTSIGGGASTLKEQTNDAINNDIQQAYHAAILKAHPARTLESNIAKTLGIDQ